MRLTNFSDYALRLLIFAANKPNETITIAEVSKVYGISKNHLMKITIRLSQGGFIETTRGAKGGLRLAKSASAINLAAVVRLTECGSDLVECFNPATNTCVIVEACDLKHVLHEALEAFYQSLAQVTLADLVAHPRSLNLIFDRQAKSA
ncbi:MAG: Rrf2 family transcriptional regulator [Pseudomonadota bacterium]|nr:Rrf2 family transcriptional regulator [Pseudomonadota bacterium]